MPRYGSEPSIASDNGYADLDDDALPELAVGRLAADTPEELSRIVGQDFGLRAQLRFWTLAAERESRGRARRLWPAGRRGDRSGRAPHHRHRCAGQLHDPYHVRQLAQPLLSQSASSFAMRCRESLSEGSLCWIYVGHAWPHRLADVEVPGGSYASISRADMPLVRSRHGAPIACLLACYTAAFDHPDDCLAEEMLRAPGGPVAVVGGSRVTMPYAMAVLGCELMDEFFSADATTLGRALVRAKRAHARTCRGGIDPASRRRHGGTAQSR